MEPGPKGCNGGSLWPCWLLRWLGASAVLIQQSFFLHWQNWNCGGSWFYYSFLKITQLKRTTFSTLSLWLMKFSWNTLNKDQILAIPKFGINTFSMVLVLERTLESILYTHTYISTDWVHSLVVGLCLACMKAWVQSSALNKNQATNNPTKRVP